MNSRIETEAKIADLWDRVGAFRFIPGANGQQTFSIDNPPPYISASHLHAGHVMSFTQADIVARYKRMMGFNVFYPMGFDDNGLPTERFVEKQHKLSPRKIGKKAFVELCLAETQKQTETYKRLFKKLGISVDWSLSYSTISPKTQKISQLSFLDLHSKGKVERRKEPVLWCTHCNTAIAQSDLDDMESQTNLHTIKFGDEGSENLLIATTRPEFLAACVAIFVHPDDTRFKHLIGRYISVPIYGHRAIVIEDSSVDPHYGTGAMMVCTWGDSEDVRRWREYRLETREILSGDGKIQPGIKLIGGLSIKEARATILKELQENNLILDSKQLSHSIKVHERCASAIEYIMATQWFIKIADNLDEWKRRGAEIKWYPAEMKNKYDAWVGSVKWDWCISRQRYFGVPFPVWYCNKCNATLLPSKCDLPVDPSLQAYPKGCCEHCGSNDISPENDVMDTWMTSSITPLINAQWENNDESALMKQIYPMSIRVQAFEIIRTWLFYTVIKSHYHTETLPWQAAVISGWGLDANGKKISKSSGQSADAEILIDQYSADAIRFWTSDSELGTNHRFSESVVKNGQRLMIKLTNVAKLARPYLSEGVINSPKNCQLEQSDLWIISRLKETIREFHEHFMSFEYSKARKALDRFFWRDFCDNYLEFIKYRLRDDSQKISQDAAKASLKYCLEAILKLYAPYIPFTTDEIYQEFFPSVVEKSIHNEYLPKIDQWLEGISSTSQFETCLNIVAQLRKYRAQSSMSFKTPISTISIESSDFVDLNFIREVMNVSNLSNESGSGNPYYNETDLKIWIS